VFYNFKSVNRKLASKLKKAEKFFGLCFVRSLPAEMEEQNRSGINKTMGCCIQHTRKLLMILQGILQQHGRMNYDVDLQVFIDEANDILSAGVIGNVRGYSYFYYRLVTSLTPLIEDFQQLQHLIKMLLIKIGNDWLENFFHNLKL
jgi:hypothetical protein